MSAIDDAVKKNRDYARRFRSGHLAKPPARRLAIVACMDARLNVEQALGLATGDAHIIRNAGGLVTEDALRSLLLSHHALGTEELMIIQHTHCGLLGLKDGEFRAQLEKKTGATSPSPASFLGFTDLEESVRRQVRAAKAHPWTPRDISVRGFIYDVETGRLEEVLELVP